MHLVARFCGVVIYFLLLIFFCLKMKNSKNKKKVLNMYIVTLCIMAFFFVPSSGNDLYKILRHVHIFGDYSFSQLINYLPSTSTPVATIYYWLVGYLKIDGLLPMITCFLFYSNIFYVFNNYIDKNHVSGLTICLSLFMIMCNSSYFEVISGIRNMLAFSFFVRCIYDEHFNDKSIFRSIPIYILCCLLHSTLILIVFLRIIHYVLFYKKTINSIFTIMTIIVMTILVGFIGTDYIQSFIVKSDAYLTPGGYSYIWESILTFFLLILLIKVHRSFKKSDNIGNLFIYKKFVMLLDIIIVIFFFEHNIFFRFNNLNLFLSIPLIISYFDKITKNNNNQNYKFIFTYCLIILLVSSIKGNLCSLKFWN